LTLSVRCNSEVVLTLPYRFTENLAENFLKEKFDWILKQLQHYKKDNRLEIGSGLFGYRKHKELARAIIHNKLTVFNNYYNFIYKRVAVKNQKRCWGSCSNDKNLNFNYRLALLPEPLCDYVIVHELCHLRELNHGKNFWAEVARTIPDYQLRKKELRKYTIK